MEAHTHRKPLAPLQMPDSRWVGGCSPLPSTAGCFAWLLQRSKPPRTSSVHERLQRKTCLHPCHAAEGRVCQGLRGLRRDKTWEDRFGISETGLADGDLSVYGNGVIGRANGLGLSTSPVLVCHRLAPPRFRVCNFACRRSQSRWTHLSTSSTPYALIQFPLRHWLRLSFPPWHGKEWPTVKRQ